MSGHPFKVGDRVRVVLSAYKSNIGITAMVCGAPVVPGGSNVVRLRADPGMRFSNGSVEYKIAGYRLELIRPELEDTA